MTRIGARTGLVVAAVLATSACTQRGTPIAITDKKAVTVVDDASGVVPVKLEFTLADLQDGNAFKEKILDAVVGSGVDRDGFLAYVAALETVQAWYGLLGEETLVKLANPLKEVRIVVNHRSPECAGDSVMLHTGRATTDRITIELCDNTASFDTVAHELTHALFDLLLPDVGGDGGGFSQNGDAGALEEGLADMIGEYVAASSSYGCTGGCKAAPDLGFQCSSNCKTSIGSQAIRRDPACGACDAQGCDEVRNVCRSELASESETMGLRTPSPLDGLPEVFGGSQFVIETEPCAVPRCGALVNASVVRKLLFLLRAGGTFRGVKVARVATIEPAEAVLLRWIVTYGFATRGANLVIASWFVPGLAAPADQQAFRDAFCAVGATLDTSCFDTDSDGLVNRADNCVDVSNYYQGDIDKDGLGDDCDPDRDGDEVPDTDDNCITNANADQKDFDSDKIGDLCDGDADNDGVDDYALTDEDRGDNCMFLPNPSQADTDNDGIGDACDTFPFIASLGPKGGTSKGTARVHVVINGFSQEPTINNKFIDATGPIRLTISNDLQSIHIAQIPIATKTTSTSAGVNTVAVTLSIPDTVGSLDVASGSIELDTVVRVTHSVLGQPSALAMHFTSTQVSGAVGGGAGSPFNQHARTFKLIGVADLPDGALAGAHLLMTIGVVLDAAP